MPKIRIEKNIRDCQDCPYCVDRHDSGDTISYYCPQLGRMVAFRIEYRSEMPKVPKDCPIVINE